MVNLILRKNYIFLLVIFFINALFTKTLLAGNSFVKSKIQKGELNLYFSSDIDRVTYFSIPGDDGYTKFVYDIHGATVASDKGISQHTYKHTKSFRIAQNAPSKLRVVINSTQKALDKHTYAGNVLVIPLNDGKTPSLTVSTEDLVSTSSSSESTYTSKGSNGYIIVIDAGHGGKDNGASCCKHKTEKKVTLSVAGKLRKRLENQGYKVYMTRDNDSFVKLPKRTKFANDKKADIFISIHANAAPTKEQNNLFKGVEVYYLSPAKTNRAKDAAAKENAVMFKDKDFYTKNAYLSLISREKIVESHKLGLDVSSKMISNVRNSFGKVDNGGVKPANFWVLVGAQMPAVLIETGYITHPQEGENLMNSYYKDLLAKGIAEGIGRYLKNK